MVTEPWNHSKGISVRCQRQPYGRHVPAAFSSGRLSHHDQTRGQPRGGCLAPAALPEPWQLDRELLVPFGQYRLMSDTGASESTATDAALISQSLVDPECFSFIVERHATSIFRYLTSRVGRSSSDDLLADVFEAAFRARHRYETRYDNALPWLLGIATNVIRHHRRSETRHTSMVRRFTQLHGRSQEPSEAVDTVVASAELNDQMHQVRRALTALDEKHCEVLVLSAGLGLGYEDIARALGIRVGTVRSRLSRARRKLRELLAPDGQYSTYVESEQRKRVAGEWPK